MKRRRFHPHVYAGIVARQNGICGCGCGEPLGTDPRQIEFDHEVELADGGADTPENLRAVIKRHHRKKTTRSAIERAKASRIARGGRLSRQDQMLARMLERVGDAPE